MTRRNLFIILLILCILPGGAFAQNKKQDQAYFIIQMTDPQFGMFSSNKDFKDETVLYEKAVVKINSLKPDFVVITGDFVHDGKDQSQIDEFFRITAQVDNEIPVYFTPGNHDIGKVDSQNIKSYIARYGYDKFSFKHKNSRFIGLNSSIIKADVPSLEQEQYKWLERELKKSRRARHILIFCHYPFFIKTFDEPETYSNIGIQRREKYLSLFIKHRIAAIFSGHLHNNANASYDGIEQVTTSAVGKPLGKAPSGFRIIKIYPERIEHVYEELSIW